MDPQTIKGEYNESCDYFSYCCVAYEVLSGKLLPRITKHKEFENISKSDNKRPPFPEWIPRELRTILLSGFEETLSKRATWDETIAALGK